MSCRLLLSDELFPYFSGGFQFRLILDTSILFGAVWGSVRGNKTALLEKLTNNPLIKICAPAHLEVEIYEKIETKFPEKQRATAQNIAKRILGNIEIINKQSEISIKKAHSQLSNRDPKDIPFLSLAFDVKASRILTNDRDFEDTRKKVSITP
jgi:predicted nucleic acid-binding protein